MSHLRSVLLRSAREAPCRTGLRKPTGRLSPRMLASKQLNIDFTSMFGTRFPQWIKRPKRSRIEPWFSQME